MTAFGLNGAFELFDHCSHNDLLNVHQNSLCVLEDCDQEQHLLFVHSIASASAKDSEANACACSRRCQLAYAAEIQGYSHEKNAYRMASSTTRLTGPVKEDTFEILTGM